MANDIATTSDRPVIERSKTDKELSILLDHMEQQILDVMPRGIDGKTLIKKAKIAVRKEPKLGQCKTSSLFHAIYEASSMGLEIDGPAQHCHIIPYGKEAQLQLGFRGLLEMARRSGQLASVIVEAVYKGDEFSFVMGDEPKLTHVPSWDNNRTDDDITHFYAVFTLTNGEKIRRVMTREQVLDHAEKYSQAYRSDLRYIKNAKGNVDSNRLSPWSTAFRSMGLKTMVKDTISRGLIPMSDSIQQQIERENYYEAGRTAPESESRVAFDNVFARITHESAEQEAASDKEFDESAHEIAGVKWTYMGVGCESLLGALESCMNSGEVTVVEEYAEQLAKDDDEKSWLKDQCDNRRAQLREAKSEA